MDLTIRAYAAADAGAIADLLNAVEVHAGAHPGATGGEIREWSAQWKDIARDTRLVIEPGGAIVAFGLAESPPEGGYRAHAFGTVAPGWRGRGIGRDLLGWQVDRIGELHTDIAPAVEWIISVGANVRETDAVRLFERSGMSVARYWFDMEAPTANASVTQVDGFRVETAESIDANALYEAHMETFADHYGYQRRSFEDWAAHSVGSEFLRAELSRIAYAGDEIASYVLSYDEAAADRLYIGQVGTRRPWRGRGLAGALLSDVLMSSAKVGKELVRLGVDATNPTGAVGVYERVGFAVAARAVSYELTIDAAA